MNRELDGYYFRVKRDGKFQNICWSDMTEEEMDEMLTGRDVEWVKSLAKGLGQTIKRIGDELDIVCGREE